MTNLLLVLGATILQPVAIQQCHGFLGWPKLKARWREDAKRQTLDWWRKFFAYIAESDFLTGRAHSTDRQPFEIDLEWIVTSASFVKILEGKYEKREAA